MYAYMSMNLVFTLVVRLLQRQGGGGPESAWNRPLVSSQAPDRRPISVGNLLPNSADEGVRLRSKHAAHLSGLPLRRRTINHRLPSLRILWPLHPFVDLYHCTLSLCTRALE